MGSNCTVCGEQSVNLCILLVHIYKYIFCFSLSFSDLWSFQLRETKRDKPGVWRFSLVQFMLDFSLFDNEIHDPRIR